MGYPTTEFPILPPDLQVSFYYRLDAIKHRYLREALAEAVLKVELRVLDNQLAAFVPRSAVKRVASFGLRGETVFPTPLILESSPFLLGYYRLLFGMSQKEFYNKGPFGRFKRLEDAGIVTAQTQALLEPLCRSLCQTACRLLDGLDDDLSQTTIHELQLLTVGPQLRGSENTRIGEHANQEVMQLITRIVSSSVREKTKRTLRVVNAAGRAVMIEFASDPDVLVTEKLPSEIRHILAIEIKGGLGEAEKSHLKAKQLGCPELWTIIRVDVDQDVLSQRSPSTTQFFHLDQILNPRTSESRRFREAFTSRIGVS